jgi:hypothetical protein
MRGTLVPSPGPSSFGLRALFRVPREWLLLYALSALLFGHLHFEATHEYPPATLRLVTDFAATRPFQLRVLLPCIANVTELLTGHHLGIRAIYRLLETLSCFLLLLGFRGLLASTTSVRDPNAATVLLLYPLLWNYSGFARYFSPGTFLPSCSSRSVFFFCTARPHGSTQSWCSALSTERPSAF